MVGELVRGHVVGERPDVDAGAQRVGQPQDRRERLERALALLLELPPVRGGAALHRAAERVAERVAGDRREGVRIARLGRLEDRLARLRGRLRQPDRLGLGRGHRLGDGDRLDHSLRHGHRLAVPAARERRGDAGH